MWSKTVKDILQLVIDIVMKVFKSKEAAEEYMSTHTLTYSTPDTILRKFTQWLGESVDMECKLKECNEKGHPLHKVPRVILFVEDKDIPYIDDYTDEFKPTGAISSYFDIGKEIRSNIESKRYCHECGNEISLNSKFCAKCGTKQIDIEGI